MLLLSNEKIKQNEDNQPQWTSQAYNELQNRTG